MSPVRACILATTLGWSLSPTVHAEPETQGDSDAPIASAEPSTPPSGTFPSLSPTESDVGVFDELSLSYGLTVASKYLFQGLDYSEGKPVLQPEIAVGVYGFSASLWFNHDLDQGVSNEFDLYGQYAIETENYSIGAGYAYFRYPHRVDWKPSHEVLADVSVGLPLDPSLSVHYDFDEGDGIYSTLGVSRELLTESISLVAGADVHYQRQYFEITGIPSVAFSLTGSYSLGSLTISPAVSYFESWENGDFRRDNAVPESWLVSCYIGQEF